MDLTLVCGLLLLLLLLLLLRGVPGEFLNFGTGNQI